MNDGEPLEGSSASSKGHFLWRAVAYRATDNPGSLAAVTSAAYYDEISMSDPDRARMDYPLMRTAHDARK
jgi:hypothetical protein